MLWPNLFRPVGAYRVRPPTHGLRRGLRSFALSGSNTKVNSIEVSREATRSGQCTAVAAAWRALGSMTRFNRCLLGL